MSQFVLCGEFARFKSGIEPPITSIAIARYNPNIVVVGSADGLVNIWRLTKNQHNLTDGEIIGEFRKNNRINGNQLVQSVSIDDDARYVASVWNNQTVKIWNIHRSKLVNSFNARKKVLNSSKYVVTFRGIYTIVIMNESGDLIHKIESPMVILDILLSHDDKYLFASTSCGIIEKYQLNDLELGLEKLQQIDICLKSPAKKLAISSRDDLLAAASNIDDNGHSQIQLLSLKEGEANATLNINDDITDMCFKVDSDWLCVATRKAISIIDTKTKDRIGMITNYDFKEFDINCVSFPIGNIIFGGCGDGILRAWNIIDRKEKIGRKWRKKQDLIDADIMKKILMIDVKIEQKKNEKLEKEFNDIKIKRENLFKKLQELNQNLIDYKQMKYENIKLKKDIIDSNDEYNVLNQRMHKLSVKYREISSFIHYKLWDSDNVIDWICCLDDGKYTIYQGDLRKNIKREKIKGLHLKHLNKDDLYRFGIKNHDDIFCLIHHIQNLIKRTKEEKHMFDDDVEGGTVLKLT